MSKSGPNAAFEMIATDAVPQLGAVEDADGVHFAVFSANADAIELELFDEKDQSIARLPFPQCQASVWHGFVPGLKAGARYGFRAHGPRDASKGMRFAPEKLLIDPYARTLSGSVHDHPSLYNNNQIDSAPHVPKCIVANERDTFDWGDDRPPATAIEKTIIYEAHVKGLTALHPDVPEHLRGTYEGLAHPAIIDHLVKLGVTAIELLPIQNFMDEPRLAAQGLRNYWGYNPIGYFMPEPRYFGPHGDVGLKQAIRALHAANIEVYLDVVYNHTAESDALGPTLSFRGLDNLSYYVVDGDNAGEYANYTGCGNTLNVSHPIVTRLVIDSLCYWVDHYHIDGFRFDLAHVLGREGNFRPDAHFFKILRREPRLQGVKLIAEPWDVGPDGYQLGRFPEPFAEWNDTFRDDTRRYWHGGQYAARDLAKRLLGSAEIFDQNDRPAWSSINFVTSHDGFTLADLVSYAHKHNAANGEDNRDGHNENHSDNHGHEGRTNDPTIWAKRAQTMRNLLATLMLSQGTPMLLSGDEFGNTQQGNNNAYCQDNEIGWLNWHDSEQELLAFVARLTKIRGRFAACRQPTFLHGMHSDGDGQPDVQWQSFAGRGLDWDDPNFNQFALQLRPCVTTDAARDDEANAPLLLALNGASEVGELDLPLPGNSKHWWLVLDTSEPTASETPTHSSRQRCSARSLRVYAALRDDRISK